MKKFKTWEKLKMEIKKILNTVDHTLLKQESTWEQIKGICDDGIKYETASVCIPPSFVKQAKEYHAHEKQDIWSRIQQNCRVAFFSHPQNVNRAYEIDRWKKSSTYKRIRQSIAPNERLYGNIS